MYLALGIRSSLSVTRHSAYVVSARGGYPDIAKRGSDVLARDSEELRCALIQLEDLERHAQQETDRTDTATDSNSNVA